MNGEEFEKQLSKDWDYLCRQVIASPQAPEYIKHNLEGRLHQLNEEHVVYNAHIHDWETNHSLIDGRYYYKIYAIVRAQVAEVGYGAEWQVVLGWSTLDLHIPSKVPPKVPYARWNDVIMEVENEVSYDVEKHQQKDRANPRDYKLDGDLPYIMPLEK